MLASGACSDVGGTEIHRKQPNEASVLGANPEARSLYNRTKGEVEAAVIAEDFPSLRISRPSLL